MTRPFKLSVANKPTREFPGVDIDRIHKLAAHARLQVILRDCVREHHCEDSDEMPKGCHSRHQRHVDSVLAAKVGDLLRQGYRPSIIRVRLRIGYNTIRRAIALPEKNNVGNDS